MATSGDDPAADRRDADGPAVGTPGVDVPDRRGRTGLDRVGLDLSGNPRVQVERVTLLTSNWYITRNTRIRFQHRDGHWSTEDRETYDRGNGATILLHDAERRTVLLIRQFRYPAYVNGHPDGMLLEVPGGLLDDDGPDEAIRREAHEETGFEVGEVHPVFEVYMSPGSVTEKLYFYESAYDGSAPGSPLGDTAGGAPAAPAHAGLAEEGEDTELVELDIDDALARIGHDIVDAKTIMLLQWAALRGPFAPA